MNHVPWINAWSLPHKYFVPNKIRAVSSIEYKLFLFFYSAYQQTVLHLLWHCQDSGKLWKDVSKLSIDILYSTKTLHYLMSMLYLDSLPMTENWRKSVSLQTKCCSLHRSGAAH